LPDAQTVDATFAVTRTVESEYLAKPSRIATDELRSLRRKMGIR